eukprot:m.21702 g.21702  ORF g.21702 m.21702 type:complete len:627 (-) comp7213_c0_seq1:78-1958(-)
MEDLNVVVVGDKGVGKTSLIWALSHEKFANGDQIPPALPVIVVPAEAMAGGQATTYIADTSLRTQEEIEIMSEIAKANVICLVFALNDNESFERLKSYWMPLIRKSVLSDGSTNAIPIVVVGNKMDLRTEPVDASSLEKRLMPLMEEFGEINVCVESSAKHMENVSKVFVFAQTCALHPIAPLYDKNKRDLKPKVLDACKRIFMICDTNKDGLLDDSELRTFQMKCFNMPVSDSELEHLKEVIQMDAQDGVRDSQMTLSGFVRMMKLFLEKNQFETIWIILRRFGYRNDLTLPPEMTHPPLTLASDATVELSVAGIRFIENIFANSCDVATGYMPSHKLETLCEILPNKGTALTTMLVPYNSISLARFTNAWRLLALVDMQTAMEYSVYLGFLEYLIKPNSLKKQDNRTAADLLRVSKRRVVERYSGVTERKVLKCLLLGDKSKNAVSKYLAGKDGVHHTDEEAQCVSTIGSLEMKKSALHIASFQMESDMEVNVAVSDSCTELYDIACLFYTAGDRKSFKYACDLHASFCVPSPKILFVSIGGSSVDEFALEFCKTHSLNRPLLIPKSDDDSKYEQVLESLASEAQTPITTPGFLESPSSNTAVLIAVGVIVLSVVALRVIRNYK